MALPRDAMIAVDLGRMAYDEAARRQRALVARRQSGAIDDVLLLVEHPPTVTLGRNARRENVLLDEDQLRHRGIELAECDRGGDVTYHGPGQIVGYPIVDLRSAPRPEFLAGGAARGLGPVDYMRTLEEILIRVVADCGVPARRIAGLTGVWTAAEPARKLAAMGIHVARGVTSHGFALNVTTDLSAFAAIVPCGLRDRGVTSLERELGRTPAPDAVREMIVRQFGAVFGRPVRTLAGSAAELALAEDIRQGAMAHV